MSVLLPEAIKAYSFRLGRVVHFEHSFKNSAGVENHFNLVNADDAPRVLTETEIIKRSMRREAGTAALTSFGNY